MQVGKTQTVTTAHLPSLFNSAVCVFILNRLLIIIIININYMGSVLDLFLSNA